MPDDNYIDATRELAEPAAANVQPMRVVRTYASDLAAASGQPAPAPKPAPVPVPEVPRKEPPIVVKPVAPPPPPPPAPKPPEEAREVVLARLRARVEASKPPAPPQPKPIEAPPVTHEETIKVPDAASGLHTYKSDFAENIEHRGATAATVLAAEADAPRQRTVAEPVKKSSIVLVLLGIAVVLFGAIMIYIAYGYLKTSSEVPQIVQTAPSLIFVDERQEIHGVGSALLRALAAAANAPLASGNVRLAYTSIGTTTAGTSLVDALQLPAPDILLRSVQPESTVGVVHAGDEQRVFFILKVDSYERSFAGMLAWEPTIAQDLSSLYPADSGIVTATTTATTTVIKAPATPTFKDEVVDSHDVRVLRDSNGKSLIMYGYWNQATLIIARDESAFAELVTRLATTRQQ